VGRKSKTDGHHLVRGNHRCRRARSAESIRQTDSHFKEAAKTYKGQVLPARQLSDGCPCCTSIVVQTSVRKAALWREVDPSSQRGTAGSAEKTTVWGDSLALLRGRNSWCDAGSMVLGDKRVTLTRKLSGRKEEKSRRASACPIDGKREGGE